MGEPEDEESVIDGRAIVLLWALGETHQHIEALMGAERCSCAALNRAMARADEVMAALLACGADGAAPSIGKGMP